MPKFREIEEAKLEKLIKQGSLVTNDRPYTADEEEAESKAIRFNVTNFPRVKPVPGTLAFRFRNVKGGNQTIINYMMNTADVNRKRFVKDFEILWNNMDEYSKKRVDIFDILCEKFSISKKKFWGAVQEGMFDDTEATMQFELNSYGVEFVALVKSMAQLPRNSKDRELLANFLGLKKDTPLFSFTDNSKHETKIQNTQINNLPSFASSIRRYDEATKKPELSQAEEDESRMLTEGKQDYVDTEWSDIRKDINDFALAEQNTKEPSKEINNNG